MEGDPKVAACPNRLPVPEVFAFIDPPKREGAVDVEEVTVVLPNRVDGAELNAFA